MSNLIGPALVHIRAAERDGVAARTMPAVRRLSISWDPPTDPAERHGARSTGARGKSGTAHLNSLNARA